MKKTIIATIEKYTKEALNTLDDLSFFLEQDKRDIAFDNVDILEYWGSTKDGNIIEEDLLSVCSKPEEMQQYFSLMLAQMPKCTILNKYDERLEIYRNRFGSKLAEQAEELIEWLGIALSCLMHNLLQIGKKYGLENPYEEEWLNELRGTQDQPQDATNTDRIAIEQTKPQPTEHEQKLKSLFHDDMAKNEKAMKILLNAVNDGAIDIVKDGLKFNGSNALLAYILGIAFCGDTKVYDKYKQGYKVKRGSAFFPDDFLSKLFGVKNLGQSRLQLDSLPRGCEKVDKWLV